MISFLEAYEIHGPDTMAIAKAMGVQEHEADRLINARMDSRKVWPPRIDRTAFIPSNNYEARARRARYARTHE